jgi:hypothetical protein
MELEQQKETVKKSGKRGRNERAPFVKDDAASDDREDIGDRKKTLFPTGKIDQTSDEEMIDHNLNEGELTEIFNFFQ